MRMLIVVPPQTRHFWFKIVARNLSSKHPDVVVLHPIDPHMHGQLAKHKVPILEPLIPEPRPVGWWARTKWWWKNLAVPDVDPWDTCDVVLILWNHSTHAMKAVRKAHVRGKKIWFIKMID